MSAQNPAPAHNLFVRLVPNALTIFRMVGFALYLTTFLLWFRTSWPWLDAAIAATAWPAVVATALLLTDKVDGWWARHFDVKSEFGARWDPRADKLVIYVLLVAAFLTHDAELCRLVIIAAGMGFLVRDSLVEKARDRIMIHDLGATPANRSGKLKMLVQSVALVLLVLPANGWWGAEITQSFGIGALFLALCLAVHSGREIISNAIDRAAVEK